MARITASAEDIRGADARLLIEELTAELAALYQVSDGSAGFRPEDALQPRSAFVVARIDGVPAGCGALRPWDEHTAEIKRVYTRPEYRRHGVGIAVLAELERLAAEAFAYRSVQLQTGPLQPEAAALYERIGYERIPRYSGDWDQILAYRKRLIPGKFGEGERG